MFVCVRACVCECSFAYAGKDYMQYNMQYMYKYLNFDNCNFKMKGSTAKIADIGLLKPQPLVQGTIIGTPAFMAPEVLEGRIYDSSADIFSLAITMWEMWYGRSVFSSCEYRDILISHNSLKVSYKI